MNFTSHAEPIAHVRSMRRYFEHNTYPAFPVGGPSEVLAKAARMLGPRRFPEDGIGGTAALRRLSEVLTEYGIDLSNPMVAAHLQPPPLSIAVSADAMASSTNASVDTYDSGPSAIAIERWVIDVLVDLAGLGYGADGVLTPGGSLSNLLGLLLARDAVAASRGQDIRAEGVGVLDRPVVFCSELAHFSVQRACAALGLGESAVRAVPADASRRLCPRDLRARLAELAPGETPVAVIATAGTTDFGTVDPLSQIAEVCAEHNVWLHVDAAYGFGALFSDKLIGALAGIELADSITLDLHKIGWQPAAASVLLASNAAAFRALDRQVDYLNPSDDAEWGYDGLLGRSLQTTRRADAVKIAATMLAYGRRGLGEMLDTCHDLACYATQRIDNEPELELVAPAELTTVVFRFRCDGEILADTVNGELRRRLMESGNALVGRTTVRIRRSHAESDQVCLKFTLLNPNSTVEDIDRLIDHVLRTGRDLRAVTTQEGVA